MKKLLLLGVAVCLLFGMLAVPAYAAQNVKVLMDDESISFDVNPMIRDGRTLVPVRKIVESMGGSVKWDESTRTITINDDNKTIVLVVDSSAAKVNDRDVALDVPASVIQGRTLVPLRFVSENMDAVVEWDAASRTIKITTPKNVDEDAFALFLKATEESRNMKQYRADVNGDVYAAIDGPTGVQNLKMGLSGALKMDAEAPAFGFKGKMSIAQGPENQDLNLEMVFKDNAIYIMDPITGKWQKQELGEEDSQLFGEFMEQSVANQVYFQEIYTKGKETGLFRDISFAGEKTINGVDCRGIHLEVNGLKVNRFFKDIMKMMSPLKGTADPEAMDQAMEQLLTMFSIDKLDYNLWIGKNDNVIYGYNIDMRYSLRNTGAATGLPPVGGITLDLALEMTVSDINKAQDIQVPEIVETPETTLPKPIY